MKTTRFLIFGFAAVALMLVARADDWDQRTVITFGAPVEIPGQVLLPGTYVFKLADSSSDRNIVQVFNKDESHLYGTFLAIPDYRVHPSDKPIITFSERPAGTPEAVRAWFYPGQDYGHDFVYPRPRAVELAKQNQTPVPSMPAELAENTTMPAATMQEAPVVAMQTAPLKAQTPAEEEVELAEVFTVEEVPVTVADAAEPSQLPATASEMPSIGLVGLILLSGALLLSLKRGTAQLSLDDVKPMSRRECTSFVDRQARNNRATN